MDASDDIEEHVNRALEALRVGEYPRALASLALAFAKTKTFYDARSVVGPRRIPMMGHLRDEGRVP